MTQSFSPDFYDPTVRLVDELFPCVRVNIYVASARVETTKLPGQRVADVTACVRRVVIAPSTTRQRSQSQQPSTESAPTSSSSISSSSAAARTALTLS